MFTEGGCCSTGSRAGCRSARPGASVGRAARSTAAPTPSRPVEARLAALPVPRAGRVLLAHAPAARPGHRRGPLPAVRRPAAGAVRQPGTSSSRARRARRTTRRPARSSAARSAPPPKRLDAVAAMGFDVIYLPPIHPIGEVNRKGPNNTLDPGPDDPGSPWAIGTQGRRPRRRSTPTSARSRTSTRSSPRATALGLEVALDLALQCAPDHPWVDAAPGVVHHPGRRHHRLRREPAEEVPGHLPAQLRQRPRRASAREVLRVVRHWMTHGVRIFRVDNPHTKPVAFWEWLLREVRAHRPRRAVPGRGVHPAGDDARPRRDRLPPVLHLLHLAHREVGDRGLPPRGVPPRPTT